MTPDEMIKRIDDVDARLIDQLEVRAKAGIWQELARIRQVMERWERKNYGKH